ncbi:MAG TPA: hypothetical protein VGA78_11050 [Gemmatimonadales bacterium]|jgi:hypothetical protein
MPTIRSIVIIGCLGLLAGCDSLLEVERPDIIEPGKLTGEAGATAAYNGAIGDFASALAGPGAVAGVASNFLAYAGLFSDEFRFGSTPPEVGQFDQGRVVKENTLGQGIYLQLHHARESAEQAAERIVEFKPGDSRAGELYGVAALATLLLGEHYCSGMPFSQSQPDIMYGQPLSTTQIFDRALDLLQQGSTNIGGVVRIANLLAVLKGRALLDQGDGPAAGAAVTAVPTSFSYEALYAGGNTATQNLLRSRSYDGGDLFVADNEGGNGLNFASAADPRVPVDFPAIPPYNGTGARLLIYNDFGTPVVQASGIEARLIEAEAALEDGNVSGWLAQLNTLRDLQGLTPVADPGTAVARIDLTFRERAFWLYSTGHRVGDMRRLVRQYNRPVTAVFPTGPYPGGITRGNQASIVIPTTEENNPHYQASDCDPSKA